MRKLLISATVVFALAGASCWADILDDPLHGYCAGVNQCIDNGTNSPTSTNPPGDFGFTVSPGPASGDLLIDLLIPNNEPYASSYALTGSVAGTATLFSGTPWTSGDLAAYLTIKASPPNSIGAYLPAAQTFDPGATGFFVFQVDLGTLTLKGPSDPNVFPLENLTAQIPEGSYIVGFLNEGTATKPNWIATANSGAILEDRPLPPVPEPTAVAFFATGLLAAGYQLRRRQRRSDWTS